MNNKSETTASDKAGNRRDFFRINEDLVFDCRAVDAYTANHSQPEDALADSATGGLIPQLRQIDREAAQNLRKLAEKDRVLSDYLQLLSRKVDLIAQHLLLPQALPEMPDMRRINVSEAGLAFSSEKAYYKGKFVAVRLIFLPSYTTFCAFAEVVRCQARRGDSTDEATRENYEVAARFHRLPEASRQLLSRQIMRAQLARRHNPGRRTPEPSRLDNNSNEA